MTTRTEESLDRICRALLPILLLAAAMSACAQEPGASPSSGASRQNSPTPTGAESTPTPVLSARSDCPAGVTKGPGSPPITNESIRVAFVGDQGVRLWHEASGAVETLFATEDITRLKFSGEGRHIAFMRQDEAGRLSLWVLETDGQHPRELLSPEAFLAMNLSDTKDHIVKPHRILWIPGTHKLAFSTLSIPSQDGLPDVFHELRVVDADTGVHATLLDDDDGGTYTFSPDGAHIALVSDTSVSLLKADGTAVAKDIVTYPALGISHDSHHPPASWDVNAQTFFFAVINTADSMDVFYNPDVTSTVWRVSVDGSAKQMATLTGMSRDHAFAPDLTQVAFMRTTAKDSPVREMHFAKVHGDWDVVYREGEALSVPQWKPFGEANAFVFYQNGEPLLGRLCHDAVPLPSAPDGQGIAREIKWVDDQRYLYLMDDQSLWLGALDGTQVFVGTVSDKARQGVRALAIVDFTSSPVKP